MVICLLIFIFRFMTLFTRTFEGRMDITAAIWDHFFAFGWSFIHACGLAMLKLTESVLLRTTTFEDALKVFLRFGDFFHRAEMVVSTALAFQLSEKDFEKELRKYSPPSEEPAMGFRRFLPKWKRSSRALVRGPSRRSVREPVAELHASLDKKSSSSPSHSPRSKRSSARTQHAPGYDVVPPMSFLPSSSSSSSSLSKYTTYEILNRMEPIPELEEGGQYARLSLLSDNDTVVSGGSNPRQHYIQLQLSPYGSVGNSPLFSLPPTQVALPPIPPPRKKRSRSNSRT